MTALLEQHARADLASVPSALPWQARLTLGFADDGGTTRLVERSHFGPLRVQKALYPEGPRICHAIVVHPPGGVVGGDQLTLEVGVGAGAHALIATPGAAKWYKARKVAEASRQHVRLNIAAGARLEYLPQESLFFDAAEVQLTQSVELGAGARYIGCDMLCFGRTASGETFNTGKVSQHTSIRQQGKLIWWEQSLLAGGSSAMRSPLGLNGNTVCATLIACGMTRPLPAAALQAMRQEIQRICDEDKKGAGNAEAGNFGISLVKTVLVARYLGASSETARRAMLCVWRTLRPELMECAAVVPRIWNT
ncbi:MAG: urease accessory protein [Janthinobacterium sp.]|jgi:urease accessory protein